MKTISNIFLTVVVAAMVSAGVAYVVAPQVTSQALGTSINNVQQVLWAFTKGVSLEPASHTTTGPSAVFTRSGSIPAGQNQAYWTNDLGRTAYIDYGEADIIGLASSSMRISAFATTTTSVAASMSYTAPIATTSLNLGASTLLIDNVQIPTSTPYFMVNTDINAGSQASGTVAVLPGATVMFLLRQDRATVCTGSLCETSTSTNRGFNVNWFISGHYIP